MFDEFAKRILSDVNLDEIDPRKRALTPVNHWSPAVLLERGAYLRQMAKYGTGSAQENIKEFPHYSVGLTFIGRTGDVEVHENRTCIFHVLGGAATLVTGGTMTRAHQAGAGELRGDAIENSTRQELRQGDVVHVPPGIPHQFLIAGEKAITCLVVKIMEVK
jgi:Cupin domain.